MFVLSFKKSNFQVLHSPKLSTIPQKHCIRKIAPHDIVLFTRLPVTTSNGQNKIPEIKYPLHYIFENIKLIALNLTKVLEN